MKAADFTHGSFYNHFDSKQSLIAACIAHVVEFAAPVADREGLLPKDRLLKQVDVLPWAELAPVPAPGSKLEWSD
jgi:AcrR family transcriptional regulator